MSTPWKFVRVVWLDAYSEDPWTEIEKYDLRDHQVESFGYLVRESKNYHLIAPNVGQGDNGVWEACGLMAIPRKMVLSIDEVATPQGAAQ